MTKQARQSIAPTYDHRETGDRFKVETRLNGRRIASEPMPDPFVHTTVRIGWRDRLRGLFGRLDVTVIVGGDDEIVEDLLELDDDYKGRPGSTRRQEWDEQLEDTLHRFADQSGKP